MGIRFTCPNGHRLHVKSFLAGKRGICPHCASRFNIPLQDSGRVEVVSLDADLDAEEPSSSGRIVSALATAEESNLSGAGFAGSSASGATATIAPGAGAAWYVRPAAGGQFGPADEAMMRQWIREARVPADSLVWRDDWPEWRHAGVVFPELAHAAPADDAVFIDIPDPSAIRGKGPPTSSAAVQGDKLSGQMDSAMGPRGHAPGRRGYIARSSRPAKDGSKGLVVLLGVLVAVLAALLVFVVVYFGKS